MEEENAIVLKDVVKEFKVLNRHEGLKGSIKDLIRGNTMIRVLHLRIGQLPVSMTAAGPQVRRLWAMAWRV